jgi:hypothetical protein
LAPRFCTAKLGKTLAAVILIFAGGLALRAQSPEVGNRKKLIFHDIRTDAQGRIVPWYADDPGTAYDHVLGLLWRYWKYMPNFSSNDPEFHRRYRATAGVKKYFVFRTLDEPGVGGDQFAMMLSSWSLYYAYTGDPEVLEDMRNEADMYIANGFSAATTAWPNIPYPCNMTKLAVYDGDLLAGKGYTQPDKAGSFGAELVTLYKITSERKYLEAARGIADTLASHVQPGDQDHSPLPYRVHAGTNEVRDAYTSNWTGTLRLLEGLIALQEGNTDSYRTAHATISKWLREYPLKTNKWGPFFEDVGNWSDTEINAGTLAWYILEHPHWDANWRADVRGIQEWVLTTLGIPYWKRYGPTIIGEQTIYKVQGQSHTSRHASVELRYTELSGDTSRKEEAVRQLNWATYMVDDDGKNWYPNFEQQEIWWTDGYGDYVRHFLRAMAAAPELAPPGQNHLLRTTSVCTKVEYQPRRITYETFDDSGAEVLRLVSKPKAVRCGQKLMPRREDSTEEGWSWQPLSSGGVLRLNRKGSNQVEIVM